MKKPPKQPQKDKFINAAKEHGCDESEREFTAKVKKMASRKTSKKGKD